METQVVPSTNGAARHVPTTPWVTAPLANIRGASFDDVHEQVAKRAARMLPDTIVHVADLVFTPDGRIEVPGVGPLELLPLAHRELARRIGVNWSRWFQGADAPERAAEVTRRLRREPGQVKLRAWRDESGQTAGSLRAILAPGYAPVDDLRIFEMLRTNIRALLGEYLFQRVEPGDETSQYAAVLREVRSVRGDDLVPGWSLRTSEVGRAPISIDDYWLRLVCMNGLLVAVGGKRTLYRRHTRAIDDEQLAASFVMALGRLPGRFARAAELIAASMDATLEHPDAIALELLAGIPRELVEAVQYAALAETPITRFGLLNVITRIAHTANKDREVRFAMESAAGGLLATA